MADVIKLFKTEITDAELVQLVEKYGQWYYKKLKYVDEYHVEKDEIMQELAVKACEARSVFAERKNTKSNIKTFIITCFKNHMVNYARGLSVRQRQYPFLRLLR